jgi:hypothetical protein
VGSTLRTAFSRAATFCATAAVAMPTCAGRNRKEYRRHHEVPLQARTPCGGLSQRLSFGMSTMRRSMRLAFAALYLVVTQVWAQDPAAIVLGAAVARTLQWT